MGVGQCPLETLVMMNNIKELENFYKGKKVLLTGHTGFKGTYLSVILSKLGAEVYGYALPAPTEPSLFEILFGKGSSLSEQEDLKMVSCGDIAIRRSCIGDIRDFDKLRAFYAEVRPDAVIHMAAQPIVRESYRTPRDTFETNIMGTVNLLEAVRVCGSEGRVISFLNVTTDKVYENLELAGYAYKEDDKLDGYDPYSNSKSCSELVTHSYKNSFFETGENVRISTARAGNVIGGGDFAKDRLIPDCMRAYTEGRSVEVRNPLSTRPFQHVFEPLFVYLTIVMEQAKDPGIAGYYNVGPDECDCVNAGELCDLFKKYAAGFEWIDRAEPGAPHEASFLRLDNKRIKDAFGWKPVWHTDESVKASVAFCEALRNGNEAAGEELLAQLKEYTEND